MIFAPVMQRSPFAPRAADQALQRFLLNQLQASAPQGFQVQQDDKAVTLQLDVPGLAREQLQIDIDGAVVRLHDMGVERYLITSSVIGIMAQRLVRALCPACRAPVPPERRQAVAEVLGLPLPGDATLFEPVGWERPEPSSFVEAEALPPG